MRDSRKDAITARTIDIALILQKMRGDAVATDYLRSANATEALIARVLSPGSTRASVTSVTSMASASSAPPPFSASRAMVNPGDTQQTPGRTRFYHVAGRRRDVVRAAVVQAAIALAGQLDTDRAVRLLRREALSEETIARVLAGDDSRRRLRSGARPD